MIYVHEVHEVLGGRMEEFGDAVRSEWRPLVEAGGRARLLWFWQLTHGTGPSYQAVSITAVRDWATWGELVGDPRLRAWRQRGWALRREVTAKVLLPVAWSPLQEVDLAAAPVAAETDSPSLYLHDTGWPFPGKLDEYVAALGSIFYPQTRGARMISVAACWTVAPGTGRHHEVVLLQKIEDWTQFSRLLTQGEPPARPGGWMEEGLRYTCTHDNGVTTAVKMGCEEEAGVIPGVDAATALFSGHGTTGAAKRCETDADCAGFGTGKCVPANLVFGFTSDDDMCIMPGAWYPANAAGGCDLSGMPTLN